MSLSAGNYGAIVFSAAAAIVLGRTLGSEEFGRLALLLVAAQSMDLAISNWTLPVLVRFGAQEWAASGTIAGALWARTAVLAPALLVAAGLVAVFSAPLGAYLTVGPTGLALVVALFLATGLAQTAGALLRTTDRMARQGVALILEKAFLLGLVLVVPLILRLDAQVALACYAAAAAVAAIWSFAQLGARALRPTPVPMPRIRELAVFSVPLIVGSWAGLFGNQAIDYVVIRTFLPFAELGQYAIAYQIAGTMQQLLIVVSAFLLPKFAGLLARGREDELRVVVTRLIPYFLLAFSFACGAGVIAAPVVVPLLFGADFAGAVAPLGVLLVTAGVAAIFSVFSPLLVAHGVLWPVTRGVVIAVMLNVLFDVILVPQYGLLGAAIATLIAYTVTTSFTLAAAHERLKMPSFRYTLFALPALAVEACTLLFDGSVLLLTSLATLIMISAALVRVFRMFGREDRALLDRARSW